MRIYSTHELFQSVPYRSRVWQSNAAIRLMGVTWGHVQQSVTNSDKLNQLVLACSGGVARQLLKNVENIAQSSKKLRWTFFSTNSICFQISYWFNKMSCKISPCEHLWLIIFKIWFTKTDPSIAFLCVSPINLPKLYFAIASKHDFFSLNMWGIWRLL